MELFTEAISSALLFDPRYTCDLDNSSPDLRWRGEPENTSGFAAWIEDEDTQTRFPHWVVYNIPANVHHLPTGIPPQDTLPNGIRQGVNGYGKLGYAGPCPPVSAAPHTYRIHLVALNTQGLSLPGRLNRDELLSAIRPRILARASIAGLYRRTARELGKAG